MSLLGRGPGPNNFWYIPEVWWVQVLTKETPFSVMDKNKETSPILLPLLPKKPNLIATVPACLLLFMIGKKLIFEAIYLLENLLRTKNAYCSQPLWKKMSLQLIWDIRVTHITPRICRYKAPYFITDLLLLMGPYLPGSRNTHTHIQIWVLCLVKCNNLSHSFRLLK